MIKIEQAREALESMFGWGGSDCIEPFYILDEFTNQYADLIKETNEES